MAYTYTGKDFTDYVSPASPGTPLNEANLDPNGLAINEIQALYGKAGAGAASVIGTLTTSGALTVTSGNLTLSSGNAVVSGTGAFGGNVTVGSAVADTGQSVLAISKVSGNKWSLFADTAANNHALAIFNVAGAGYVLYVPNNTGYFGIANTSPSEQLDVTGNSKVSGTGTFGTALTLTTGRIRQAAGTPPASAGAAGNAGEFAWESGFFYVCTATNTWERVAIATWV